MRRQIDRHPSTGAPISKARRGEAGQTIAGNDVVAAEPLELVEGRPIGQISRGAVISGRIKSIGEVGAANSLDVNQRIGADRGIAHNMESVARDGFSRHCDVDARRSESTIVVRLIKAAAAVDGVIAGAAIENLA